jgi:Polyketide cyclase / dehydrase and lipid transport
MKILKVILIAVVLVAGTIGIVGAALPAEHSVSRTIVVPASADRVFALISHVQDYPHWRTGVNRVDVLPEEAGQFHWVEDTTMGKIPQLLTANEPLSRRVVTIADPDLPWGGTWTYELVPQGLTTKVTITENGYVKNVYLRFLNTYVIGQSSTIDQYESDLVKAVS